MADLAFDSALIARAVAGSAGSLQVLTQPGGFVGTDGWFILLPDGRVRRGLAVFRIERSGPELIDPAPQASTEPVL